jgi:hypothetical protein
VYPTINTSTDATQIDKISSSKNNKVFVQGSKTVEHELNEEPSFGATAGNQGETKKKNLENIVTSIEKKTNYADVNKDDANNTQGKKKKDTISIVDCASENKKMNSVLKDNEKISYDKTQSSIDKKKSPVEQDKKKSGTSKTKTTKNMDPITQMRDDI